ncbi:MAG TPA: LysM domain-containing protein [Chthoniobacterales bacterium]
MRVPFSSIFLIGFLANVSPLFAQTPVEADADLRRQVGALREAVIQQTRQIDALTAEIERLGVAMGQRRPAAAAPAPAAAATTPAPAPATTGAPATETAPAPAAAATPTPDPNVLQHTVVKGDNLTNLAKKYNTSVEAIQKLNKITDARKMQVGQVLSIPTPAPAAAASPSPAGSPAAAASPDASAAPSPASR